MRRRGHPLASPERSCVLSETASTRGWLTFRSAHRQPERQQSTNIRRAVSIDVGVTARKRLCPSDGVARMINRRYRKCLAATAVHVEQDNSRNSRTKHLVRVNKPADDPCSRSAVRSTVAGSMTSVVDTSVADTSECVVQLSGAVTIEPAKRSFCRRSRRERFASTTRELNVFVGPCVGRRPLLIVPSLPKTPLKSRVFAPRAARRCTQYPSESTI